MSYGRHTQCPNGRLVLARLLYFKLSLSYERGGELVIEGADDEKAYAEAGAMILYPSTTLHRVDPVTGTRLVIRLDTESRP